MWIHSCHFFWFPHSFLSCLNLPFRLLAPSSKTLRPTPRARPSPPPPRDAASPPPKVFALFAPYGLLVLIPINLHENSGADGGQHESSINNFNRLSMSNIQHYDPRMWLHALGMYLLSTLAMYFLVVEYRRVLSCTGYVLFKYLFET